MKLAEVLASAVTSSSFEAMMLKAIKGTSNAQSGFKIAIEQIEQNTKNKKILTLVPVKTIDLIKVLPGDEEEKKVSGRYMPDPDKITLRQPQAMRMLVVQLIKHEFGHHLADNFLNPKNHDSHGHLINPK